MYMRRKRDFKIQIQYDAMDCGSASLQMVADHFGCSLPREKFSSICNTTPNGISFSAIKEAAEKIGLKGTGVALSIDELVKTKPLPAILHWNERHFVVLYRITHSDKKRVFKVADPSFGEVDFTEDEMREHWIRKDKGSGILMFFEKSNDFKELDNKDRWRGVQLLLGYFRRYKKELIKIALCVLIASCLQLVLPFLTQAIVDIGIGESNLRFIYLILFAQLALIVGRTAGDFIRRWILLRISVRINLSLISDFLKKMVRLPMSFFYSKKSGDILQRIDDHKIVETFITTKSLETIFSFFTLTVFSVVLLYYNLNIFFIFIISGLLYAIWVSRFLRKRRLLNYKFFNKRAKNQSDIYQIITGMEEMKLHGCADRKLKNWETTQLELLELHTQSLKLDQQSEVGNVLINEGKNILITVMAATSVISGDLTLGMMLSIQYIIGQLAIPVEQAVGFIISQQDVRISLDRINDVYLQEDESTEEHIIPDNPLEGDINISNITFRYDTTNNKAVLKNLSCTIKRGKTTAIVGTSGSGKTTLLKLLLQYYRPETGSIKIGERDLNDYNPDWWREQCSTVMQNGYIFSDTIAHNISPKDNDIDNDRLIYASKVACIEDTINELPLKFDTFIGMEGQGLSVGQKQRLLIARAVYKNVPFILFDEATNSLDSNNEKEINNNLLPYYKDKTVIIVAHRLSSVKNADNILVMDNGQIIESGCHKDLIDKQGHYYHLIKNQLEL